MDFTTPLLGGLLIGGAVIVLYAGPGRVAGVSGILYAATLERAAGAERPWRLFFLAGLVLGGWLAAGFGLALTPPGSLTAGQAALLASAGLLTGIGTRLGSGCTSGHGICGTARLSPRSIIATIVFMTLGMVTATLLRPLLA